MNAHSSAEPPKGLRLYRTLFLSSLQLSAFTFGGGYVIVPLMRRRFVEQLHWIDEEEMLDMTAIAQAAPGAMAVNAALLVGYRMAGFVGALVTMAGTILPPLLMLTVISYFYEAFRDNTVVALILKGMRAGVAAVNADVVDTMARGVARERRLLPLLLMAGAFAASYFFAVNVALILLICGAAGALDTLIRRRREEKP